MFNVLWFGCKISFIFSLDGLNNQILINKQYYHINCEDNLPENLLVYPLQEEEQEL